jgi:acyl-CoA thioesterase
MVAAGKTLPGRPAGWTVRSAHALFVAVAAPGEPLELGVETVRAGRSFASAVVTAGQAGGPGLLSPCCWTSRSPT